MINFFDTNYWVGEYSQTKENILSSNDLTKSLLERKKIYNILGTALSHFNSIFSPETGNDSISELLIKKDITSYDMYGVLTFEMNYLIHQESFKESLIKRYMQGFKIIRLCPKTQKYSIGISGFKKFYEVLNYYKFPVFVGLGELDITGNKDIEWDKIYRVADKFKNIPIIIDGQDLKLNFFNSYLIPLLEKCKNIYVNMHRLIGVNQIEILSEKIGSEKIIFDSYYPYMHTNLFTARLLNSFLNENEKKNIASLNIKKIFNDIQI